LAFKLTDNATKQQLMEAGYETNYVEHGLSLFYTDSNGVPWTAAYIQAKDDPITDLTEDMAAEQKARTTYNHLLTLTDDPGVIDTLRYLREREIVHFQRFGEALVQIQDGFACKKTR